MSTYTISESKVWNFSNITMGWAVSQYSEPYGLHHASNNRDTVRLHMGIKGDYSFSCPQLNKSWDLIGGHHNILYCKGIDLEVRNKSMEIETFGVEFPKNVFLNLVKGQDGIVSGFCKQIIQGDELTISKNWGSINVNVQNIINEILSNPYSGNLENMYLFAKTLDLLVLCLHEYQSKLLHHSVHIKSTKDKEAIIAARDYINKNMKMAPSIPEIARHVGLNEFKLKYGFKEMFGKPIFSYLMELRLHKATRVLRDTLKPIKEIADELGFSSPQHLSTQYKQKTGLSPKEVRGGNKFQYK
ncbi:helix-turn-helix domain-containing protein [Portibacter marinus]|uniref:helix-turn-helix domain-containing protein n=1 Tax=Portibacter marinus TaxID=2898660 RepID=UPI001F18CBD1|nr:AraC family transcriptional regulator [Portibacter marinus]